MPHARPALRRREACAAPRARRRPPPQYDWRLPIPVLEERDAFFSRAKAEIELQHSLAGAWLGWLHPSHTRVLGGGPAGRGRRRAKRQGRRPHLAPLALHVPALAGVKPVVVSHFYGAVVFTTLLHWARARSPLTSTPPILIRALAPQA